MIQWLSRRTISVVILICLLMSACSLLGQEQDEAGPSAYVVIGGTIIPEEGPPTEGGYALEGEDIVSPGPTIKEHVGEPVTITFKNVDDYLPEPHNFVIVAEKDWPEAVIADPLWGAKTEPLRFGEQQTITFTPDTPGSYFYICSVSDHLYHEMWGRFIVED